jgi:LPS-assembly protein
MATTMALPLRPATLLPALTPVWLVCMAWVSVPTAHAQSAAPLPEPQALRCPAPSSVREALRASDPQQTPPQQTPPRRPAQPATTGTTPTLVVGDDPRIEISSDSATLGVDGDAVLKGDVRVIQGERTLSAEDVTYDAEKNLFKVEGTVRYVEPSLEVSGRGGSYDPAGGAAFEAATFALPERPARGAAERMELEADGDIRLQQVWFSTCPAEHPDWRIRASRIDLDMLARNGTGRDAAVEFKGVPILYLPWISFPVGDQRKSGFLFPSVGYSSRSGAEIGIPYYFNLAPNYDLTFDPVFHSRRGVDLGGRLRYLTERHQGRLQARLLPSDSLKDADREWLQWRHDGDLGAGWHLDVDAQHVSDAEYFEDFSQGGSDSSTTFLDQSLGVSYEGDRWALLGELRDFQTIDRALAPLDRPYATLPRLLARGDLPFGPGRGARAGLDAELVRFDRDVGVTGWRLDARPRLEMALDRPGWFARPGVAWRYTRYDLSGATTGADAPSRSLPSAWVDVGLRLERITTGASAPRVTLEPRMLYLWTPFREQEALPVFDTALPDLDFGQLFSTERYVGADRVADANQLSLGATARVYDGGGRQLLSATLGQIRYFETPRVRLPDEPVSRRRESDLVAELGVSAWSHWTAQFGLQWNTRDERRERNNFRLRYSPDQDRALNLAYNFQQGGIEQAEFSGAWPIGREWSTFGKLVYDLQTRSGLEQFAGVEFRSCCWRLRAVGRRYVSNRTGERDTQFYLQLELNGLSSVGSGADAFLEEAFRGYSRSSVTR